VHIAGLVNVDAPGLNQIVAISERESCIVFVSKRSFWKCQSSISNIPHNHISPEEQFTVDMQF
jgi:hypothetical protein